MVRGGKGPQGGNHITRGGQPLLPDPSALCPSGGLTPAPCAPSGGGDPSALCPSWEPDPSALCPSGEPDPSPSCAHGRSWLGSSFSSTQPWLPQDRGESASRWKTFLPLCFCFSVTKRAGRPRAVVSKLAAGARGSLTAGEMQGNLSAPPPGTSKAMGAMPLLRVLLHL